MVDKMSWKQLEDGTYIRLKNDKPMTPTLEEREW